MEFLNPEGILEKLNLRENQIAADFGCGSGGWAIPLSRILKRGKIFAIDILEEPLSALSLKLKTEKIYNVEIRKADVEEKVPLLPESVDLVLMTNLLFECKNKKKVLEEGKRILKKGGKILVVDWKENSPIGPEEKVNKEEIKRLAEELGLELKEEFEAGSFHYGLIFEK
jgi:ubiquinone/menaquinone biosynthesis C-methylase UbiE